MLEEPRPGPARHVGHRDDLQAAAQVELFERRSHQVMLHLVRRRHLLIARVLDADVFVGSRTIDVDVEILVDGCAEHKPAVLRIVRWQIGAAAAQWNAERRAGQDHAVPPPGCLPLCLHIFQVGGRVDPPQPFVAR